MPLSPGAICHVRFATLSSSRTGQRLIRERTRCKDRQRAPHRQGLVSSRGATRAHAMSDRYFIVASSLVLPGAVKFVPLGIPAREHGERRVRVRCGARRVLMEVAVGMLGVRREPVPRFAVRR